MKKTAVATAKEKNSKNVPGVHRKKEAFLSRTGSGFFQDTRSEVARVEWPGRETVIKASLLVFLIVVFYTVLVSGFDVLFAKAILWLKGR